MPPGGAQKGPRSPKRPPRGLQEAPRRPQEAPKRPQEAPKRPPRGSQEASKRHPNNTFRLQFQAPLFHVRLECIDAFARKKRKLAGSSLWLDVELERPLLKHHLKSGRKAKTDLCVLESLSSMITFLLPTCSSDRRLQSTGGGGDSPPGVLDKHKL